MWLKGFLGGTGCCFSERQSLCHAGVLDGGVGCSTALFVITGNTVQAECEGVAHGYIWSEFRN